MLLWVCLVQREILQVWLTPIFQNAETLQIINENVKYETAETLKTFIIRPAAADKWRWLMFESSQ